MFTPARKPAPKDHMGLWAVLGAISFFGVLIWLAPKPTPAEQAASDAASRAQILAERTIDTCWEQQARKSLSPETQQFVADAYEISEEDYRSKYGRYYKRYGQKP